MASDGDHRIRRLAAMARALSRRESLSRLLEIAAEEACDALSASTVSVSRVEPGALRVRTVVNVGDLSPSEERWPQDEVYAMEEFPNLVRVLEDLTSWVVSLDDPDGDRTEQALLEQLGKGSSAGSPIVLDGALWGEFFATRAVGAAVFSVDDVAFLEALIAILAGALARAVREEHLELLASRDPLTGLLNRRALDEHAQQVFDVPHSPAGLTRPVTAVMIDINGLKTVNDRFGHPTGDQLIQAVADTVSAAYQRVPGSVVARVGGDEFVVLVAGRPPHEVVQAADELCGRTWDFGTRASISCGAASILLTPSHQAKPHQLFAAADEAQYVAKRGRLARTVTATPSWTTLP